jgi:hypothetical protein
MRKVKDLEARIKGLSADELAAFRRWFAVCDAEAWDREFEADVAAGKLDGMAAQALRDRADGRSTALRLPMPLPPLGPATVPSRPRCTHSPTRLLFS